jgi:hypothetical protein
MINHTAKITKILVLLQIFTVKDINKSYGHLDSLNGYFLPVIAAFKIEWRIIYGKAHRYKSVPIFEHQEYKKTCFLAEIGQNS